MDTTKFESKNACDVMTDQDTISEKRHITFIGDWDDSKTIEVEDTGSVKSSMIPVWAGLFDFYLF